MVGRRFLTVALGAMLATACATSPGEDGSLDAAPCSEVLEAHDEQQEVVRTTAGGGVEGRDALAAAVELIEARPDCFRAADIERAEGLRGLLPVSEAEQAAIEAAEARCPDGAAGSSAVSGSASVASTPEDALTSETELSLPPGAPEGAAEADDWIAFDLLDGGVYEGAAFVHRAEDGWFVRRVIDCRGGDDVVEDVTDDGGGDGDENASP